MFQLWAGHMTIDSLKKQKTKKKHFVRMEEKKQQQHLRAGFKRSTKIERGRETVVRERERVLKVGRRCFSKII